MIPSDLGRHSVRICCWTMNQSLVLILSTPIPKRAKPGTRTEGTDIWSKLFVSRLAPVNTSSTESPQWSKKGSCTLEIVAQTEEPRDIEHLLLYVSIHVLGAFQSRVHTQRRERNWGRMRDDTSLKLNVQDQAQPGSTSNVSISTRENYASIPSYVYQWTTPTPPLHPRQQLQHQLQHQLPQLQRMEWTSTSMLSK